MSSETLPRWWFIDGPYNFSQYKNTPSTEQVRNILCNTPGDVVAILLYPCLYDQWNESRYEQSDYIRRMLAQVATNIHKIVHPSKETTVISWDQVLALQSTHEIISLRRCLDDDQSITIPNLQNTESLIQLRWQLHQFWQKIQQKLQKISFF